MKKLLYVALLAVGVFILMTPPAMAQEEKPFTLHGEIRFRGEYQANANDLNKDTNDNADFWPYRVRIAAEGRFSHNIGAWIEFQSAGNAGGTLTPVRLGNADVFAGEGVEMYQGNITFNQLWSKNFSLRVGRQEIVAGNELMLGDLDFYSGLSHDGFVANWNLKKVNLMLWATRPAQVGVNSLTSNFTSPDNTFIGGVGGTQNFWGGYATWTFMKDQTFDVYAMDLDTKVAANVQTIGVRYAHDVPGKTGFFWDAELAKQFGKAAYGTPDVKANGNADEGWFGYNWRSGKNNHRFYGRIEQASGDKTTTADKNEGFVPMFGDFHNRTGHGDWFVLANDPSNLGGGGINGGTTGSGLKAWSVAYTGYFTDKNEFGVAYWKYKLDQKNVATGHTDLGNSTDIWYGYNYSKNTTFTVSLSQLKPGDALKDISAGGLHDDTVTRLYGQARLRF